MFLQKEFILSSGIVFCVRKNSEIVNPENQNTFKGSFFYSVMEDGGGSKNDDDEPGGNFVSLNKLKFLSHNQYETLK